MKINHTADESSDVGGCIFRKQHLTIWQTFCILNKECEDKRTDILCFCQIFLTQHNELVLTEVLYDTCYKRL